MAVHVISSVAMPAKASLKAATAEAGAAGLPGTAWRAHALLSTFAGADPEHTGAARSIVEGLTASLEDNTLATSLTATLERELGENR